MKLSSERLFLGIVLSGLALGGWFWFSGNAAHAHNAWVITTLIALIPICLSLYEQFRRKELGVDAIALFAIVGCLWLHESLAGAIISLMLVGGQSLEMYAKYRAETELRALLARAPRFAYRYDGTSTVEIPIEQVQVGDRLLIKSGSVIPVDGVLLSERAVLDESALSGEARPVEKLSHDQIRSGVMNAGAPFDLQAITTPDKSTYAGIVRLVKQAQMTKAPLIRLADKYAIFFVPFALGLAGLAWLITGNPLRALAVMVVATPCPLILAAPVAIISGISRAAKRGIIIKHGGALETLARADILLLDKTGTLTTGVPTLKDVEVFGKDSARELLRLAASLDQVSHHVLASAILRAARQQNLDLVFPTEIHEEGGVGISGVVDGRKVAIGKSDWVTAGAQLPARAQTLRKRSTVHGSTTVFASIDGQLSGVFIFEDPLRMETSRTIRMLKRLGFRKVAMVTGDHEDLAKIVSSAVGADTVFAECTPEKKIAITKSMRAEGITLMVGDGLNDAPALASAHVGIAMGARGATATSESADVVLLVDQFDRVLDAVQIARRSRAIAVQSILIGMSLSGAGMVAAAFGFLPPVMGAFLQEAIDVFVILYALRALKGKTGVRVNELLASEASEHLSSEHEKLYPQVARLRSLADRVGEMAWREMRPELVAVKTWLIQELLPHEDHEDSTIYPLVAQIIGGDDPTATMSREHLEIAHLAQQFAELLEGIEASAAPTTDDVRDFRRILYGLYALLNLHFAQENEQYLSILNEQATVKTLQVLSK